MSVPLVTRTARVYHGPMKALLEPLLQRRNGDTVHEISAVGHAHIDTAWLWPLRESIRKWQRDN